MKLSDLKSIGAFASKDKAKIQVSWKNQDTEEEHSFDVHVRRHPSFATSERIGKALNNPDTSTSSKIISECVYLGEEGEYQLSYEEACELDPSFAAAIMQAYYDYMEEQKEEKEKKRQQKESGTSSSVTESAETQSPTQKKT